MSASLVIVREVAGQETAQVPFAKDEYVIQTLTPDGADEPLREGVLPRAVRRREDFTDAHALQALPEHVTVDGVAIAEEIRWGGVVREGVHDLLGRPGSGGMLGDIEMEDAPAVVGEHDEDEQNAQARGGNGEEIDRDEVPDVIGQERAPRLRRRGAAFREQAGDGALSDVDAELEELTMDSRGAPEGIGGGHSCDKGGELGVDGRATPGGPAGELGPVLAEAPPRPSQDGGGGNDHEGVPPPGPDRGQPDPEEPISRAEFRPGHRSLVHGELLPQGEVLEGELVVAAAEEREEPKEVEQDADHRAGIFSGSKPIDQPLAAGRSFGEGQVWSSRTTSLVRRRRKESVEVGTESINVDDAFTKRVAPARCPARVPDHVRAGYSMTTARADEGVDRGSTRGRCRVSSLPPPVQRGRGREHSRCRLH